MSEYHISVLLHESVDLLDVKPGKQYIDATLGGGGHSVEILKRGGKVLSIDTDQEAIDFVIRNVKSQMSHVKDGNDWILAKGNFRDIDRIAKENGIEGVSGILFDLGVSTHQLEASDRGFSFNKSKDARLDMRMNQQMQVSALDLVNGLTEKELAEVFWKYGEEHFAKKIAKRIVHARRLKQIETTDELSAIVLSVRKRSFLDRTHPATRVFQALRIAVNDELYSLEVVLPKAFNLLTPDGVMAFISFHSLEDRIVKKYFAECASVGKGEPLTEKPIVPSAEEVVMNPRSRSAKLRGIKKL